MSVGMGGCATAPPGPAPAPTAPSTTSRSFAEAETPPVRHEAFERDRAAILHLAGTYAVTFHYQEGNPLREGYHPQPPDTASATEHVLVVEDAPEHIVLQHLLVTGNPPLVIKHWREDWAYSPPRVYQYIDDDTWALRPYVTAGQPGMWTRTTFGPDDAPQYGTWGKWSHVGSVSSWASTSPVFAPKPLRESTRGDYTAMRTEDRVTLSPLGWSQEQLNTKTFLQHEGLVTDGEDRTPLVRETGNVRYTRPDPAEADQTQRVAETYWREHAHFWREARQAWARLFDRGTPVTLREAVDGQLRWRRLFDLAQGTDPDVAATLPDRLDALLSLYRVEP